MFSGCLCSESCSWCGEPNVPEDLLESHRADAQNPGERTPLLTSRRMAAAGSSSSANNTGAQQQRVYKHTHSIRILTKSGVKPACITVNHGDNTITISWIYAQPSLLVRLFSLFSSSDNTTAAIAAATPTDEELHSRFDKTYTFLGREVLFIQPGKKTRSWENYRLLQQKEKAVRSSSASSSEDDQDISRIHQNQCVSIISQAFTVDLIAESEDVRDVIHSSITELIDNIKVNPIPPQATLSSQSLSKHNSMETIVSLDSQSPRDKVKGPAVKTRSVDEEDRTATVSTGESSGLTGSTLISNNQKIGSSRNVNVCVDNNVDTVTDSSCVSPYTYSSSSSYMGDDHHKSKLNSSKRHLYGSDTVSEVSTSVSGTSSAFVHKAITEDMFEDA